MAKDTGKVNIHGKEYLTVAYRVKQFRDDHPNWSIMTEIIARDENEVVTKTIIADESGRILASGFAEEKRSSSQINRTSALENAETSSTGRCLAALGYLGTEYASADEVANAIGQQNEERHTAALRAMAAAAREHWVAISMIKSHIGQGAEVAPDGTILINDEAAMDVAAELWNEIPDEAKAALWVAPTKGGLFETWERKIIHSDEFAKIRAKFRQEEGA